MTSTRLCVAQLDDFGTGELDMTSTLLCVAQLDDFGTGVTDMTATLLCVLDYLSVVAVAQM